MRFFFFRKRAKKMRKYPKKDFENSLLYSLKNTDIFLSKHMFVCSYFVKICCFFHSFGAAKQPFCKKLRYKGKDTQTSLITRLDKRSLN